jgi:oxalate decarboxylase/phosphoglucose isomerase-like protein (cupin superfamily)
MTEREESLYIDSGYTYREFLEAEGIPVHRGHSLADVREAAVGEWDRTGARGAVVQFEGHERINDVHLHEIPPGEATEFVQPLYEEVVYVAEGSGATAIRDGSGEERVFEWGTGSVFFLPRNARYKHLNADGDEPTRLVCNTDLPVLTRLIGDEAHIFEHGAPAPDFAAEYDGDGDLSVIEGVPAVWEANFVPDIAAFDQLVDYDLRGGGGTNVKFRFPGSSSLWAHVSEFDVGRYKKAHKHGPGANLLVISGEGFSLMWPPGDFAERVRVDWTAGALVVPPGQWYHQHFNTSGERARYLALHPPNVFPRGPRKLYDPKTAENQLEYHEEPAGVREAFEAALAENGLESRMPAEWYEEGEETA